MHIGNNLQSLRQTGKGRINLEGAERTSTLQEFLWARGGNDTLQRAFYKASGVSFPEAYIMYSDGHDSAVAKNDKVRDKLSGQVVGPSPHLVFRLPARRQTQMQEKKMLCQRLWLTEPKTGILQRTRYGKVKIDHMRNIKICEAMGLNMSDEEFNRLREGLPVYNPTGLNLVDPTGINAEAAKRAFSREKMRLDPARRKKAEAYALQLYPVLD
ncbi:hypothetical protein SPFM20_00053 [Salmonella phage SPFM20]|nr:hypothetical protein SPFM20_00053 [Salmonella phage SPFM20]